jgi:hypothetical protein
LVFCPYTGPAEVKTPDNIPVKKKRAPAGIRIEFFFIPLGYYSVIFKVHIGPPI